MNGYIFQTVRVSRNVRTGALSVQTYRPGIGWRVNCSDADHIDLSDVTFSYSEAGRQRMLSEGHKNVFAHVEGRNVPWPRAVIYDQQVKVYPKCVGVFFDACTLLAVTGAKHVRITADGRIYATGLTYAA